MRASFPVRYLAATAAASLLLALQGAVGCSASSPPRSFGSGGSDGDGSSTSSGKGGEDIIGLDGGLGGGTASGGIPQTCADAIAQQSYIGCEYWPTVTSNAGLYDGFEFAITAANPTGSPAEVTVKRGGNTIEQVSVPPGQLKTIKLPWVDALKQDDPNGDTTGFVSTIVAGGAYQVTSTVPITLYQFNPLEFELASAPSDCPLVNEVGGCFSFTNDASLLLPTTALRGDYYAMSYATLHLGFFGVQWSDLPGFVSITATQDGTTVKVTSSAHVRSGPGVNAQNPGQQSSYTLNAGDVLALLTAAGPPQETPQPGAPCVEDPASGYTLCPSSADYDLTGTHIEADKPVSVIGGHDCTFVPFSSFACDHLEESIFPVDALGKDLIVTAPQAVSAIGSNSKPDNMFVRILSAVDGNKITFDPPVHAQVTLNAGKWLEIGPVSKDFRVKADNKILVGQFMVGENFTGESVGAGDPSLSIAIPTEQYRLEYTFFAPTTYTNNFVNVVAPPGATIEIDGAAISAEEFTPIGASGMSVARHAISGGTHTMTGNQNFGIAVYGYGSYTSYMYPGGLNLETITIIPD